MKYGKPEDIRQRTFRFAVRVINLSRVLPKDQVNRILINQIVRSATSIGANLEEAAGAHTKAEFTNSTNIARRESRETYYWLQMIYETNSEIVRKRMKEILQEANEIVSILVVSVKNLERSSVRR